MDYSNLISFMQNNRLLAVVTVVALFFSLVPAGVMGAGPEKTFSVVASPTVLNQDTDTNVTFTITNTSSGNGNLSMKSGRIGVPASFSVTNLSVSQNNWSIQFNEDEGRIEVSDGTGQPNAVDPGASFTISATITPTEAPAGPTDWTVCTYSNESFNSGGGADFISDSSPDGSGCGIVTLTILTPSPETATLIIQKVVIGGSAATSSFSFVVNESDPVDFDESGTNEVTLELGNYAVVEGGVAEGKVIMDSDTYMVSYSEGCSGELTLSGATCIITNTVTAVEGSFTLTIAITGDGEGQVEVMSSDESEPMSCTRNNEDESACTKEYAAGTEITLTATAFDGSNFDNSWSVGAGTCTGATTPCTFTMDQDYNLVAHFGLNTPTPPSSGGGGSSSGGSSSSGGRVAGASTDTPAPRILGEQISLIPEEAPDTGAGGTSTSGIYAVLNTRSRFVAGSKSNV